MFKLEVNPTFWQAVQLTRPGVAEPVSIEVEFAHKTRTEMKDFFAKQAERRFSPEANTVEADVEVLAGVIRNWKEVDLPFSRESLATLLDRFPASGRELYDAYNKALLESRTKN